MYFFCALNITIEFHKMRVEGNIFYSCYECISQNKELASSSITGSSSFEHILYEKTYLLSSPGSSICVLSVVDNVLCALKPKLSILAAIIFKSDLSQNKTKNIIIDY